MYARKHCNQLFSQIYEISIIIYSIGVCAKLFLEVAFFSVFFFL